MVNATNSESEGFFNSSTVFPPATTIEFDTFFFVDGNGSATYTTPITLATGGAQETWCTLDIFTPTVSEAFGSISTTWKQGSSVKQRKSYSGQIFQDMLDSGTDSAVGGLSGGIFDGQAATGIAPTNYDATALPSGAYTFEVSFGGRFSSSFAGQLLFEVVDTV